MTVGIKGFRIVKRKWADTAFDGKGAGRYGGRWNSKGERCVYLAGSESLATLEMLVHLNSFQLREEYVVFRVDIPLGEVLKIDQKDLPDNWQEDPAPAETAIFGDDWLTSKQSVALWVPSTIIPSERNILLNPEHPSFDDIVAGAAARPYKFDQRLK